MKSIRQRTVLAILAAGLVVAGAGCVSAGGAGAKGARGPSGKKARNTSGGAAWTDGAGKFPRLSLDTSSFTSLGQAFRHIGESTDGGGAVLLAGLEDWAVPRVHFSHMKFTKGIEQLVSAKQCKVQVTPYYVFVYPPGYEQLEAVSFNNQIAPRFAATVASFAVGAGTDLYNALALLGDGLRITVVADNAVADAWSGEVFVNNAPIPDILAALFKSARIPATAVNVESTDEYILMRSAGNANRQDPCLNKAELSDRQRKLLAATVSVHLPRTKSGVVFEQGALPLSATLGELSQQLGMTVTADEAVAKLPVNVIAFNNVSVETALNLIVWQWPVPGFGYRVTEQGVQFCTR